MRRFARGLCLLVVLTGCGETDAPEWSSCEDARATALFLQVPSIELSNPVEEGDELPVLRWGEGVSDPEELATQSLALACILTGDEVKARPALLEWAESAVEGGDPDHHGVFDRDITLSLRQYGPRASLYVGHDVSARASLDEPSAEARATELVESLFEDGAVEGASIDDASLVYFNRTINGRDGTSETMTRLASVTWRARAGRAHLGIDSVDAHIDDNGHVSSITVPLARLYDEGERVRAEVAETDALSLFVEKAEAALTLEGWTVEDPVGQLSVPVRDPGDSVEMMWVGSYVPVSGDRQRVGRGQGYFMSLSDPDAPLIDI